MSMVLDGESSGLAVWSSFLGTLAYWPLIVRIFDWDI